MAVNSGNWSLAVSCRSLPWRPWMAQGISVSPGLCMLDPCRGMAVEMTLRVCWERGALWRVSNFVVARPWRFVRQCASLDRNHPLCRAQLQ
eukprot:875262-Amphidinium_carterae.1